MDTVPTSQVSRTLEWLESQTLIQGCLRTLSSHAIQAQHYQSMAERCDMRNWRDRVRCFTLMRAADGELRKVRGEERRLPKLIKFYMESM